MMLAQLFYPLIVPKNVNCVDRIMALYYIDGDE